jgi:hypothetical protein
MGNKKRYSLEIINKAKTLRRQGQTHREIAKKLNVSVSIAHLWTKGIILTSDQKRAIELRRNKISLSITTDQRRVLARKNLARFWKPTPTDGELLQRIIDFYDKHERIPLKREFNSTYREYKKRFGGWNSAVRLAGFKPNPVVFSYKFKSKDGHLCDSFAEKIVDDWLYDNNIEHIRNFRYGNTKMTADFMIQPNIVAEFFGLAGVQKKYDGIINRKREYCKNSGLKLIEIYPKDVVPKNKLPLLFSFA